MNIKALLTKSSVIFFIIGVLSCTNLNEKSSNPSTGVHWTIEQANAWYDQYPFLAGGNYVPASAINQLEMWQEETFDPKRIDFEFRIASEICV